MKVELRMRNKEEILRNHGLQKGGPVQKFIDEECIKRMSDYTPHLNGHLIDAATFGTVLGSGEIHQTTPYAHYLYYGFVYEDPELHCAGWISRTPGEYYGRWFSRNGVIKVPTNRELQYTGAPMRGKKWFERMKADHKDDILRGAQALVDRGGKA